MKFTVTVAIRLEISTPDMPTGVFNPTQLANLIAEATTIQDSPRDLQSEVTNLIAEQYDTDVYTSKPERDITVTRPEVEVRRRGLR